MAFPIIPLLMAGYSLYSSERAKSKARKSENELEESLNNTPQYRPNQSILDYYQTALNKYNVNPTDTREFKATQQGIKQGTVQGLKYAQDRRSGQALIPTLISGQNNSLLKAAVEGERRKAHEFAVLGQATGMRASEEGKAFHQNVVAPFEAKYNLLAMKAAGQNQVANASLQNAYNNASAVSSFVGGDNDGFGGEYYTQKKFGDRYGAQGAGAYNWAKANNMSFGKYRRTGNRIGSKFTKYGVI